MNEIRVKMLKAPFNYKWPGRSKISCVRGLGPMMLDKTIAEAAIEQGYAEPFDPAKNARKPAARRTTAKAGSAKSAVDATDKRQPARMDRTDMARDDRAESDAPVVDAG